MNETFENIRHIDEAGQEYWLARELAIAIGYKKYENFKPVIHKAMELCHKIFQKPLLLLPRLSIYPISFNFAK